MESQEEGVKVRNHCSGTMRRKGNHVPKASESSSPQICSAGAPECHRLGLKIDIKVNVHLEGRAVMTQSLSRSPP